MNFLTKLFGSKTSPSRVATPPAITPATPSADPARDPNLIRVFDAYGRELFITKQAWRDSVLLGHLQKVRNDPEALYSAIVQALQDGFGADLVEPAEHLAAIDPVPERGVVALANVYHEQGRPQDSGHVLRSHMERHGESALVLANLAKVQPAGAEQLRTLWHALELDPNQEHAFGWYEAIHRDKGGPDAGLGAIRRIAALPGSWRARLWLARAALETQDLASALTCYREALELGATVIVLIFQNTATAVLIGFGFGASLLALFMRVGGGIFTKAADVGADLVGKIEKDIPEDDPRNAATIADNVGDNVGDCAGMAADIFESYEVTIVAAMILGLATFGHKGVIFPLLVRGIGVLGSIISTYTVKAGPNDTSDTALKSVHNGFWIGSIISVAGFFILGWFYLRFEPAVNLLKGATPDEIVKYWGTVPSQLAWWANFGVAGLDLRPAITCLIGVFLAVALNKVTSYYTHTTHAPVKALTKACTTGHATNIIEGFALGYESTVAMMVVIVVAIFLSVLTYAGTPPMFIAYGVAMTGIGMLTLTGNTISMDVFGPVADNANGIGEMGYEKERWSARSPAPTSAPGRSSPTSTRWATPPRPRPRASPSAPPSSRP